MEDTDLLQPNSDDEVMVRQTDGTFKKMKMSELSAVPVAGKQAPPLVQAPPTVPAAPPARTVAPPAVPVAPPPPVSKPVTRSSEEVQPASARPVPPAVISPPAANFESRAGDLVDRLAADVSEDLKPRVKMLLVSYMKGIRQEYAVRERLLQSIESGGLGWSADKTDVFIKQMKALSGASDLSNETPAPSSEIKKETRQSKDSTVSPPEKTSTAVSVASSLLPEIEPEMHMSKASEAPPQPRMSVQPQAQPVRQTPPPKSANAPHVESSKPMEPRVAAPPQPKTQKEKPAIAKPILPKPEPAKADVPKKQPVSAPSFAPFVSSAPPTSDGIRALAPQALKIVEEKEGKPRVITQENTVLPQKPQTQVAIPHTPSGKADVKDIAYKPRLVGPIDELRTLTLVDFRRLSRDPQVAVDKIHSKVELLGEESFEKKIKGVLAWRASEVNGLYTALLNESIKTGVPIKEIIGARASRKENTLTMEEFQAIMNLNRQLRF